MHTTYMHTYAHASNSKLKDEIYVRILRMCRYYTQPNILRGILYSSGTIHQRRRRHCLFPNGSAPRVPTDCL